MNRTWLRNSLLVGALACAAYGTASLVPGVLGYDHVKVKDAMERVEYKTEQLERKLDYGQTVRAGDGSWRVAKRAIVNAQQQSERLAKEYEDKGYRIQARRLNVAGVEVKRLNNDAINRIARVLPSDERNSSAYYCPSQFKQNDRCGEYRILLSKKSDPNRLFTDVAVTFDAIKEVKTAVPAQYKDMPRTGPRWLTGAAYAAAAGLGTAYVISARRQRRGLESGIHEMPGDATIPLSPRRFRRTPPSIEDTQYLGTPAGGEQSGTAGPAQGGEPSSWRRMMSRVRDPASRRSAISSFRSRFRSAIEKTRPSGS